MDTIEEKLILLETQQGDLAAQIGELATLITRLTKVLEDILITFHENLRRN